MKIVVFNQAIQALRRGDTLTDEQRAFVLNVLILTRTGRDPRRYAGTDGLDPREEPRALVAMHYAIVKRKLGKELAARTEVSTAWGLSISQVARIAAKYGTYGPEFDEQLSLCESMAAWSKALNSA